MRYYVADCKREEEMKSLTIIGRFVKAWENNSMEDFVDLVEKDAKIYHPYFERPINAEEAMEVMNTAVSGTSSLEDYEIIHGNGDGNDDQIRLFICDSGNQVSDICYVGIMPILVSIHCGKISQIKIEKGHYKKIRDRKKQSIWKKLFAPKIEFTICLKTDSTLAIAIMLARYWGSNFSKEYINLFTKDAVVHHVMYEEDAVPEVVVDVMNSNVLGTTELYSFEILSGDGKGTNDVAYLKFIETGNQIGYVPDLQGVMKVRIEVKNHKITDLDVQGYEIINIRESKEEVN